MHATTALRHRSLHRPQGDFMVDATGDPGEPYPQLSKPDRHASAGARRRTCWSSSVADFEDAQPMVQSPAHTRGSERS